MKKTKSSLLVITMLLMASWLPDVAIASNRLLQVWQVDGSVMTINLSEEPVTTYEDGSLVITTAKTIITYPLEQVSRYTYVLAEPTSEGDGVPDEIKSILSNEGETLSFRGLKSKKDILLYSASGQLLRTIKPNGDNAALFLSQLPTGVYLVKTNGATYKISKK